MAGAIVEDGEPVRALTRCSQCRDSSRQAASVRPAQQRESGRGPQKGESPKETEVDSDSILFFSFLFPFFVVTALNFGPGAVGKGVGHC